MAEYIPDNILNIDPYLEPFAEDIRLRGKLFNDAKRRLLSGFDSLSDFADCYKYFGIHRTDDGWVYREWAPAADQMYFTGDFNGWDRRATPLKKLENGVFELFLPGEDALWDGCTVMTVVIHQGQELERIPLYATRVVQDPQSYGWNAVIHIPKKFQWTDKNFKPKNKVNQIVIIADLTFFSFF